MSNVGSLSLTAHRVRIRLWRTVRHASHTRTTTDNLVVACRLPEGIVGYGEGVPRDYVTGETAESAWATLQQMDATALHAAVAAPDFATAVRQVAAFELPTAHPRGIGVQAARCAVELAVLDALGQRHGQPLAAIVPLLAPELHAPQPAVRYSTAITSARGIKAWLLGLLFWAYGFAQCKVKVGIRGHDDVARLRTIRRGVGRHVLLHVDANEAWPVDAVARHMRSFAALGVRWIEQPVAHDDLAALAKIKGLLPLPVMLDESLCTLRDAQTAIELGLADLFNLRLSKCGGFLPTLRLAQFAAARGVGYQLGCQVGETAILSAAGRHFASAVRGLCSVEGSYDRYLVRDPLSTHDVTFGYGGWAPALSGPGLGVRIDPAALARVTMRSAELLRDAAPRPAAFAR